MTKNFSTVMNVILTIAVTILFYLNFSNKSESALQETSNALTDSIKPEPRTANNDIKDAALAFVNSDSIFENYEFYKTTKKDAESKMAALENNYKTLGMKFQDDYNNYVDKAGKGMYSKEQAQKIEADLTARKQKIDAMEMQVGTLQEITSKAMNEVQMSLSSYFNQYAKDNNITCIITYNDRGEGALGVNKKYDITNVAIQGLNTTYKAKLDTEKNVLKK